MSGRCGKSERTRRTTRWARADRDEGGGGGRGDCRTSTERVKGDYPVVDNSSSSVPLGSFGMSTTHDEINQQVEQSVRLLSTRNMGLEGVQEGDSVDAGGERDTTGAAPLAKCHCSTGKIDVVRV